MRWKNLSSWLKGGLYGILFGVILAIIYGRISYNLFNIVLYIPGYFFCLMIGACTILGHDSNLLLLLGNIIFYFFIGAIIGLIIGKIRGARK